MESKHKNALIGGLLAIVFIMAVGFAGFTQTLTINDSASVTSTWNIGFKSVSPSTACGAATSDCGTVDSFTENAKNISLTTKLSSPGNTVDYTIVVKNYGTVPAKVTALTPAPVAGKIAGTVEDSVIEYTVTGIAVNDTLAPDAEKTIHIIATFKTIEGSVPAGKDTNTLNFNIDWAQDEA